MQPSVKIGGGTPLRIPLGSTLSLSLSLPLSLMCYMITQVYNGVPVVAHKAVAEVSKIGNP